MSCSSHPLPCMCVCVCVAAFHLSAGTVFTHINRAAVSHNMTCLCVCVCDGGGVVLIPLLPPFCLTHTHTHTHTNMQTFACTWQDTGFVVGRADDCVAFVGVLSLTASTSSSSGSKAAAATTPAPPGSGPSASLPLHEKLSALEQAMAPICGRFNLAFTGQLPAAWKSSLPSTS